MRIVSNLDYLCDSPVYLEPSADLFPRIRRLISADAAFDINFETSFAILVFRKYGKVIRHF